MVYPKLTDDQLTELLRSCDGKAFEELYKRYWRGVFLVAYEKTHHKEIAEELTQAVFEGLWKNSGRQEIQNIRNYLFTAVRYQIINYFKSRIQHQKFILYSRDINSADCVSPEESIYIRDFLTAIERGIALLPDKTRSIFNLSRIKHFSVKEISESMKMSEKAVEYHITKSVKAMRHYLDQYLLDIALVAFFSCVCFV